MPQKLRGHERKRQRQLAVDDSSEDDELMKAAIDEIEDDESNEAEAENEADINDEELQELEDEEEDDDDDDEDESLDENEPDVEEVDGVEGDDDDEPSLDDDDEQPDDDFDTESDPTGASRRMTARQRNRQLGTTANIGVVDLDELDGSNRTKKKALSAEEQRIKRAEMARRRRNLSQKRLEEEKQDTLDKLLKKRAGKVRGDTDEQGEPVTRTLRSKLLPPHPAFLSWRSAPSGFSLSMTEERAKHERLA